MALAASAALICSADRAVISVAILPMSLEYGWSDSVKGAISSAFYVGYTLTNLVGGYLAATVGSKRTLGGGVVVWSTFTVATPAAAASGSLPVLMATRCLMGCGEGTAFPSIQQVVKGFVPPTARSRALTAVYASGQLGTILALLTSPWIINTFGWQSVFWLYGSMGLFWILAWQPLVAEVPPLFKQAAAAAAADGGSPASSSGAAADGAGGAMPAVRDLPWGRFFSNRAYWGTIIAHSMFGCGHYVKLSWLPTFYNQAFGVDMSTSAMLSVLPWLATVVCSTSSGWLADWLVNSGTMDTTSMRKTMQTIGAVAPAACLLAMAAGLENGMDLPTALALMTGGVALGGFQSAGFASNHQDIAGRYSSLLFGITNALSSLVGSASVAATGLLLDAGCGWSSVWQVVAVAYLIGAAGFATLASGKRQFE